MTVLQVILAIVVLAVLPTLGGIGICRLLKTKPNIPKCLLTGTIALWSVSQLFVVPMVLLRASFTAASNAILLVQLIFAAFGVFALVSGTKVDGWMRKLGSVTEPKEKPQKLLQEEDSRLAAALEEMELRAIVREGMKQIEAKGTEGNAPADVPSTNVSYPAFDFASRSVTVEEEATPEEEKAPVKVSFGKYRLSGIIALVLMFLIIAVVLYQSVVLRNADEDDSRFVVNAVEMVRTDRLFLTNPATGEALSKFAGELSKDALSPWAVYPASVARWAGMNPTVLMHSVFPILMIILVSLAYYLLSGKFFHEDLGSRCFFVFLLWLINIFGYYSIYGPETFVMIRSWQGKAVVASFAIPMMLYMLFSVYEQPKSRGRYLSLLAMNLCMCFLSGNGIIIGAVMLLCYGIVYAIARKSAWILLKMLLLCIPNAVYYYLYTLVSAGKI